MTVLTLYCQTPVQSLKSRLGVDFVFPLSQEQQQEQQEQQQEQQPHQNIAEESILEVLNLTHRLIPSSLLPSPTDINPIRLGGGAKCFCLLLINDFSLILNTKNLNFVCSLLKQY